MFGWIKRRIENLRKLEAALDAAAKPATELIVEARMEDSHVFSPTATHFGGNPYFEQGDSWPTLGSSDRPYDFVCQVNLRDCPVRPDMPFDFFAVYLSWFVVEGGGEEADVDYACIVRTYRSPSDSKATPVSRPPPHDADDYRVRPCSVRTDRFLSYPNRYQGIPALTEAVAVFRNPDAAYEQAVRRLGVWADCRSRVGGNPTWAQDNTLEYDDLVFLAQIDYEPEADNCIGDAAPIYIAVSASDPTRIETDPWQTH